MKHFKAEYPFKGYWGYISRSQNDGRARVALVPKDKNLGKTRLIMSYARYLMCVKEKRILSKDEEVDHIDDDRTNDDISNLQILSGTENKQKERKRIGRKYIVFKCPGCGYCYEKPKNKTHLQNGGIYTTCSKKCSRKFQKMLMDDPFSKKVEKRLDENIIAEFVYHDYPF